MDTDPMDDEVRDETMASELEQIQARLRELRRQLDERQSVHTARADVEAPAAARDVVTAEGAS